MFGRVRMLSTSTLRPVRSAPVRAGSAELTPAQVGAMRDSTGLLGDWKSLRERYDEDGYLLLRGLLDRGEVLEARNVILSRLVEMGRMRSPAQGCFAPGSAPIRGKHGVALFTDDTVQNSERVRRALENPAVYEFFQGFYGEPATTYSHKWLRAVAPGEHTGAHFDSVYMGRGTNELMTAWIPLGDVPVEQGTILVKPGTHCEESVYKELHDTYGQLDVDRDVPNDPSSTGHLTDDPASWAPKPNATQAWDPELSSIPSEARCPWVTEDFKAGDCVLFGIRSLHMSTTNQTDSFRVSCDTRWQPASHPMDERWAGAVEDGKPLRKFIGDRPEVD